jgi:hypothetical protein
METTLRNFLEIPYDELEQLNLEAKEKVQRRTSEEELSGYYLKYPQEEKRIKAVTVCFTDIEGKFHMLDYDKKFLIKSSDNLTFDGSSIRGFSVVKESDLRLEVDWGSFRWLPSDVFGPGKVLVFALIKDRDGRGYMSDMRGRLSVKDSSSRGATLSRRSTSWVVLSLCLGAVTTTLCRRILSRSSSMLWLRRSEPWHSRTRRITRRLLLHSLSLTTLTATRFSRQTRCSSTSSRRARSPQMRG